MPAESLWHISDPTELGFDSVDDLQVRLVGGTVNIVGTEDPGAEAKVEVSSVDGPPLTLRYQGRRLVIAYDDLPVKGFLKWLTGQVKDRSAVVSVRVPAGARVSVGVVEASAVVSNVRGPVDIHGVTGDLTLVRLPGKVKADTVSGAIQAQSITGELSFHSVSGDVTVLDGGGGPVSGESVSGDLVLDLDSVGSGADLKLTTVSGEVAVRLPHTADAVVDANTTMGAMSSGFDELRIDGQFGTKRLTGTLGRGGGRLRATTVTGAIALLQRPPREDVIDAAPSFSKEV